MAKTYFCKSEQHVKCRGTVIMGAPQALSTEKCKCKCHKLTN